VAEVPSPSAGLLLRRNEGFTGKPEGDCSLKGASGREILQVAAHKDERRYACVLLVVGKPEGKRPLGRPRRMWVDNIRIDLGEIVRDGVDWISLVQDRDKLRGLMKTITNIWAPSNPGIFLNSYKLVACRID
jgi:hypothetical protein